METVKNIIISTLASATVVIAITGFADESQKTVEAAGAACQAMPMMQGQPGHRPMMAGRQGEMPMPGGPHAGMMNPQMMQNMMAMKQQHMQVMETHLANIESLLAHLVELQKKQ